MQNGGSFHSHVKLPEGKTPFSYGFPMVFPLKPPFSSAAREEATDWMEPEPPENLTAPHEWMSSLV